MAADDESHLLAAEVSGWVWTWIEAVMYPCIVLASLKPIRTAIRPARTPVRALTGERTAAKLWVQGGPWECGYFRHRSTSDSTIQKIWYERGDAQSDPARVLCGGRRDQSFTEQLHSRSDRARAGLHTRHQQDDELDRAGGRGRPISSASIGHCFSASRHDCRHVSLASRYTE